MVLEGLQSALMNIGEDVKTFISEKPITSIAVGAGVVGAGVAGAVAIGKSRKKTKSKTRTKKGRSRDRKYISKQKHERKRVRKRGAKIYKRKGKWLSRTKRAPSNKKTKKRTGKIYYTKKGQPYKILASGKARFVKKGGRK